MACRTSDFGLGLEDELGTIRGMGARLTERPPRHITVAQFPGLLRLRDLVIPIVRDARLVVITSCVHFGFEPVVVAEAAVADTVLASIHVVLVPLLVASPDAGTLSSVGILAVICCECPVSNVSADVSDSLIRFTSATYLLPVQ